MSDRDVAVKGGIWTSVSMAVTMLATMGRVMILTRFLAKSDFGLVSITNMLIALCATFTDLGFASVIMYKQNFTVREFSSLYWIQFIFFLFIYGVIALLSPAIAVFYEEPVLATILPIAALSVVFQAIGKLYDSVLQKKYLFKMLAFRNIISNLVSLLIAVLLAWKGYGVYSLVISTLSQVIIINIWNFVSGIKIQKPKLIIDFKGAIPLIKIGVYQTGTRILDFLSGKLDVMIIGKLLGTEALGVYDLAKELVFKLVDFVRSVVSKVALPILSNNNNDDNAVKSRFLLITKTVAFLCIPICITVAVFSRDAVIIMYGKNYVDAAPLVSIFAIVTIFTSITSFFDMLGIAKGRTDLNFKNTIYRILVTTPVIILTALISIKAVAWGQLGVTLIMVVIIWFVVVQNTYPMSFKEFLSQFSSLLVVMSVVAVVSALLIYVFNVFGFVDNWLMRFILYITLYCMLVAIGARTFLRDDVRLFVNLLKRK